MKSCPPEGLWGEDRDETVVRIEMRIDDPSLQAELEKRLVSERPRTIANTVARMLQEEGPLGIDKIQGGVRINIGISDLKSFLSDLSEDEK